MTIRVMVRRMALHKRLAYLLQTLQETVAIRKMVNLTIAKAQNSLVQGRAQVSARARTSLYPAHLASACARYRAPVATSKLPAGSA